MSVFGVFWSVFSRMWTEYEQILRICPFSVRIRENTDHRNSGYGYFSRNDNDSKNRMVEKILKKFIVVILIFFSCKSTFWMVSAKTKTKYYFLKKTKQSEPTITNQEPIRIYREPTRNWPGVNQNHARIEQKTSRLLLLFIPARE